jgi:hypothetical protein
METVGWLAVMAVSILAALIIGYVIGYRSGFDDRRDGVGEL